MYKSSLHPLYNNFQNAKYWNIFELLFHGIKMIKITCYTLFQDISLELSLFQIKTGKHKINKCGPSNEKSLSWWLAVIASIAEPVSRFHQVGRR